MDKKFANTGLIGATQAALQGLKFGWREKSIRRELLLFIPALFVYSKDSASGLLVILWVILILAMELMNTAIEELCDHLWPGRDERAGKIKDLAAGAIFTMVIGYVVLLGWEVKKLWF